MDTLYFWLIALVVLGIGCALYTLFKSHPKCAKHGIKMEAEYQVEDMMPMDGGILTRSLYCPLCREEENEDFHGN